MTGRAIGMLVLAVLLSAPQAWASPVERGAGPAFEEQGRGAARAGRPASVAEAERLFDRYMLGQARVVLQLTPDQMVSFAQRFDRLQMLQRVRQRQRQRRLVELAASSRNGADDAAVAGLLESLDVELAEADRQVREAREELDRVLTVRQRARYRAFEVRMEREKLQLISRARAEARGRAGQTAPASPAE
jgi:hypothetical protein